MPIIINGNAVCLIRNERRVTQLADTRKVPEMLGVFLFLFFFAFLCILFFRFQKSQEQPQPSQMTLPWWVKIITETPRCTYYFGPFDSVQEAKLSQPGYIEDLEQEGAIGIAVDILQEQPTVLTIDEEDE